MQSFITANLTKRHDGGVNMKVRYITIEREYGSGGTEIAKRLSERIGIPCYSREILEAVATKYGVSTADIERYEEGVTGSFLYSVYMMAQTAKGSSDMLTGEGHLFVAEQEAIRTLAKQGRGIFVGHCAQEALKDEADTLSVFIRSSNDEEKKRRIVSDYGIEKYDADRVRKKFDKKRANYYYANTMKHWDDVANYAIVLDSGVLGIDGCVDLLAGLLK